MLWARQVGWELGFHIRMRDLSFCGPVVVGDVGLYYVLCDQGCLTADSAAGNISLARWSLPFPHVPTHFDPSKM